MNHDTAKRERGKIARWLRETKGTVKQAATIFHTSQSKVYRICKEFNVNPKNSVPVLEIVANLQNTTLTQTQISQKLGVSRQRIHEIVRRCRIHGIVLRMY